MMEEEARWVEAVFCTWRRSVGRMMDAMTVSVVVTGWQGSGVCSMVRTLPSDLLWSKIMDVPALLPAAS